MRVYFSSPNSQLQAHIVNGHSVLLSYAICKSSKWIMDYVSSFDRLLIDSGAFTEMTQGKSLSVEEYADWAQQFTSKADAIAGLDDIGGDWRRSMSNYERFPQGFPTFHDTDPPELLDELICMAQERPSKWIGLGLKPPRKGKRDWVYSAIEKIPSNLHIHGWALREHPHSRMASSDSTNWWRDGFRYKKMLPFLSYAECLELVIKRYQREVFEAELGIHEEEHSEQVDLAFGGS